MDARDVLIAAMKARGLPNPEWEADAIINRLSLAGFDLVHRDENHGPTLERAAEAVGNHNKTGREWVPGSLWDSITQETVGRIRAMEVKHG